MDPATATSLTLAILPLIIAVIENYEYTFRPIVTFHRHRKEAKRFQNLLRIQKTAFENECRLLLSTVTTHEDEMLNDRTSELWRDEELDRRLAERLDESFNTCVSTLELVNESLVAILKETGGFDDLLKTKEESGKSRLHLVHQKLKLSFSKPRLEDKVDDLRKHNGDLRVLVKQIKRLKDESSTRSAPPAAKGPILKFETVRKVSEKLYDAFSSLWACKVHAEHLASICLHVEDRRQIENVRFNMALTYIGNAQGTIGITEKPLWLTVESLAEQSTAETSPSNVSLPIRTLNATLQNTLTKGKSVRFAIPTSPLPNHSSNTLCSPLNLCSIQKDPCLYLQERFQNLVISSPLPCIGFLQKTTTCKHFIYPCDLSHQNASSGIAAISLNDALTFAKSSQLGIPLPEKLRLAKLLALGVLQFHSTPWLQDSWRSRDVFFFGIRDLTSDPLCAPYLNARFVKANPAAIVPQQTSSETQIARSITRSLAPNSILYSLGIMLIELGFDAPLQDLQLLEDIADEPVNQLTEFWTAKRLGAAVSNKLGRRYGRVVQRCLNCDFGIGEDYKLENIELQGAVFQDVVKELDLCVQSAVIC
ncbi:MAG: hypothetical protein Q9187_001146 [Circinaria calcarea]